MLQPQSKRPGERARAFLTRADVRDALRCLLLALILSFVTEAICHHNPIAAAGYVFTRPLAFLYNTLLIACTLSLALLVKRRRFAYTLISAIWVVLSIVDCCIRLVRITPLNFYDFVIFVSNFSITQSYVTWWQIALIVLAVAALITGMVLLFRRTPRVQPARRPALLLLAALFTAAAVIVFALVLSFARLSDGVIRAVNQVIKLVAIYLGVRAAVGTGTGRPLLRGMLVGLIYMAVGVMLYAVLTAQHLSAYAYAADILMGVAAGGLIAMLRARKR